LARNYYFFRVEMVLLFKDVPFIFAPYSQKRGHFKIKGTFWISSLTDFIVCKSWSKQRQSLCGVHNLAMCITLKTKLKIMQVRLLRHRVLKEAAAVT
jgi:hypothetical protein